MSCDQPQLLSSSVVGPLGKAGRCRMWEHLLTEYVTMTSIYACSARHCSMHLHVWTNLILTTTLKAGTTFFFLNEIQRSEVTHPSGIARNHTRLRCLVLDLLTTLLSCYHEKFKTKNLNKKQKEDKTNSEQKKFLKDTLT